MAAKRLDKYKPIWDALKKDGICAIVAIPEDIASIKRGVIKAKYQDIAYKIECTLRTDTGTSCNGEAKVLYTTIGRDAVTFELIDASKYFTMRENLRRNKAIGL